MLPWPLLISTSSSRACKPQPEALSVSHSIQPASGRLFCASRPLRFLRCPLVSSETRNGTRTTQSQDALDATTTHGSIPRGLMKLSPGGTAWPKRAHKVLISRLKPSTRLITRQGSDAQDSSLACDGRPVRWAPCLASGSNDRSAPSAAGPAPRGPERKAAVSLVPTRRRYTTRPASHMRPM